MTRIRTKIAEEVLKGDFTEDNLVEREDRYVCRLTNAGATYILKGYSLSLPLVNDSEAENKIKKALENVGLIYQEYYLSKIGSAFSPHFAKVMGIQSAVVMPQNEREEAKIFIETLFEYGGETLENRRGGPVTISEVYNWMRQSANALYLLQLLGISHLDIKPGNIVYNSSNNLLKVIDMGSSTEFFSNSSMYKVVNTIYGRVRDLTVLFSPPELLRKRFDIMLEERPTYIIGNIDVYTWGMCFYSLLLKKGNDDLDMECSYYKMGKENEYEEFLNNMERDFSRIHSTDRQEKQMKACIKKLLKKALQFDPIKRQEFYEIIRDMREFEEEKGIKIPYKEVKLQHLTSDKRKICGIEDALQDKLKDSFKLIKIADKIKTEIKNLTEKKEKITKAIEDRNRELKLIQEKIDLSILDERKCEIKEEEKEIINIRHSEIINSRANYLNCEEAKTTHEKAGDNPVRKGNEEEKNNRLCDICKKKVNAIGYVTLQCGHTMCVTCFGEHQRITFPEYVKGYNCDDLANCSLCKKENVKIECKFLKCGCNRFVNASFDFKNQKVIDAKCNGHNRTFTLREKNAVYGCVLLKIRLKDINSEMAKSIAHVLKNDLKLTSLDLGQNNIGDEGAITISEALKNNITLISLNLCSNLISKKGEEAISKALRRNSTLKFLDIYFNKIGYKGASNMLKALKTNKALISLNIGSNRIFGEKETIDFGALEETKNLVALNIHRNQIGDEGVRALFNSLKVNKVLTELNIGENNLGIKGAEYISNALERNETITKLDLFLNAISNEGTIMIAKCLVVNKTLKWLNIGKNQIEKEGAQAIAEALEKNTVLTTLNLGSNNIGKEGAKYISDALRKNTTLTSLDIRTNSITHEGAKEISEALMVNSTLSSLNICLNQIGNLGVMYISKALEKNKALSHLDICSNKIEKEGAEYIANALKVNTSLISIDMSINILGKEGAQHLSNSLKKNTKLRLLNIHCCKIGEKGSELIVNSLETNMTLKELPIKINNEELSSKLEAILTRNKKF